MMVQLIASFYFSIDISHPEAEEFLLALSEMAGPKPDDKTATSSVHRYRHI